MCVDFTVLSCYTRRISRHHRILTSIARTATIAAVAFACALPTRAAAAPPAGGPLQNEKLRQEIRQLQLENRDHTGIRGFLSSYGGLLTGIAALGTVLIALGNLVHQRDLDRQQRRTESVRRLDERFAAALTDLGASSEAVQAGAAVSLLSFLRPEHHDYHRQVRLVALANLKVRKPGPVTELLIRVLQDAFRTPTPVLADEVDFASAELGGINLAGLDLRAAVLREAKLDDADLTETNLMGVDAYKVGLEGACLLKADLREAVLDCADGRKAVFQGANLNAIKLRDANLTQAKFESSDLQSAHFERAHLEGARFHSADINDAFIRNVTFDDATLQGLSRTKNKWKAHFSPDLDEQLRALDPKSGPSTKMPPAP